MKKYVLPLVLLMTFSTAAQQPASAPVPELPFETLLTIDGRNMPTGLYLGEVAGVAVNSKGHIFAYSRTGSPSGQLMGMRAAQLFEFDASGKFLKEIGQNLFSMGWAHSVKIDKDDNIWIVDNGTHMLTKFDPSGHALVAIGRRQESVQGPLAHDAPPVQWRFNEPTDIAWDSKGNSYISDGYANSRVAKLDKDGHWVKAWGEKGSAPGQFSTPHSIAVYDDLVYVADRGNERIQVFDTEGKFIRQISSLPRQVVTTPMAVLPIYGMGKRPDGTDNPLWPAAMCITPGPNPVMYTADYNPGRIYKSTLDGKLLGVFGQQGLKIGQFGHPHNITCPAENELYTGENRTWRIQKVRVSAAKQSR